jgi:hypothetical protein
VAVRGRLTQSINIGYENNIDRGYHRNNKQL